MPTSFVKSPLKKLLLHRAIIWYWDHLKKFIKEIPQGPVWMPVVIPNDYKDYNKHFEPILVCCGFFLTVS